MKITLDAEIIAEAITDYLEAKEFNPKDIKLTASSTYGAVIAEVELQAEDGKGNEGEKP